LGGVIALVAWVIWPDHLATSAVCTIAGLLHVARLERWQGWQTSDERLVLVLHLAYAALPIGFFTVALVPFGLIDAASALHVFTVGAIGLMTLAIMSRATRGHTGLPLTAPLLTATSYGFLIAGAVMRPIALFWPNKYLTLVSASGLCWMVAFVLYLVEYAPALLTRRKARPE
jgi:uncharacterized protein involved in response to NO